MKNNLFSFFFICIIFLALIWFLLSLTVISHPGSEPDMVFPMAPMAENISFQVLSRKNISIGNSHRVQFRVQIQSLVSKQEFMAVVQKIVKNILQKEDCHSISIDFGVLGYADFAPFGNWAMAGEFPINDYKDYKFKYQFHQNELGQPLK